MRQRRLFARFYARVSVLGERAGAAEHRRSLLAGLTGRVIEVGAGDGLNFAHYPTGVADVVAVEPNNNLRRLAVEAARGAPVPVRVVDGAAEALAADDASFDAGVVSLVLCSVRDQATAVAELRRVIRPGGQLRFFEHVVARERSRARLQRAVDHIWPAFCGGCHTSRDTLGSIADGGFRVRSSKRLRFPDTRLPIPTAPHVLGVAVRPS